MNADTLALDLARLEFGVSASIHYLFVPLTLGLALALCLMEAAHVRTGLGVWADAARFWRRFFVLAWLVGVATGYPLRWQLQAHWPGYSDSVHEVFSAVMTLEAWIAPLMLALVAGLSLVSSLGPRTRLIMSVLLLLAMAAQAAGILTMNAWMQHPVGVAFEGGSARLTSLADVFGNPYAHTKIAHTLSASVVTGAFFMLALAGSYLRTRRHLPVARVSLRLGIGLGLVGIVATLYTGHQSALDVARHQPMKFAAMEAHWQSEDDALVLWAWPDMQARANRGALELPHAMGLLVEGEEPAGLIELMAQSKEKIRLALQPDAPAELAAWRGLYQQAAHQHADVWPRLSQESRLDFAAALSSPKVPALFTAFRLMAAIGVLLLALLALAWHQRRALESSPIGRRAVAWMMVCAPLPWIATLSGWVVGEMGRQPWVVYGQLLTAEAALPLPMAAGGASAIAARLAGLVLLAGLFACGAAWLWHRGPGPLPRWPTIRPLRPSLR